jgi:hypothetical protein
VREATQRPARGVSDGILGTLPTSSVAIVSPVLPASLTAKYFQIAAVLTGLWCQKRIGSIDCNEPEVQTRLASPGTVYSPWRAEYLSFAAAADAFNLASLDGPRRSTSRRHRRLSRRATRPLR